MVVHEGKMRWQAVVATRCVFLLSCAIAIRRIIARGHLLHAALISLVVCVGYVSVCSIIMANVETCSISWSICMYMAVAIICCSVASLGFASFFVIAATAMVPLVLVTCMGIQQADLRFHDTRNV